MSRSLMPLFNRWDPWDRLESSRIFDQQFGVALADEDFFSPIAYPRRRPFARQLSALPTGGIMPRGVSDVSLQGDKFQVMVDVSHFSPEEIVVKTVDDSIQVTAKHEERPDEHGYISRQFSRRYLLPKDIDPFNVSSSLSPEGILTIIAPKKQPQLKEGERMVPINLTPESPRPAPTQIPVQNVTSKAPAP